MRADEISKHDALSIHRRAVAVDMHADTVQFVVDEGADISVRVETTHLDAVRMREGGLDAQFFSIWVEPEFYGAGGGRAVARADEQVAAVRALAEKRPESGRSRSRPPTSGARPKRESSPRCSGSKAATPLTRSLSRSSVTTAWASAT